MRFLAVAVDDDAFESIEAYLLMTRGVNDTKEVVIDDIDGDTFETVGVLT